MADDRLVSECGNNVVDRHERDFSDPKLNDELSATSARDFTSARFLL